MAFDKTGFTTYGASKSGNAVSLYGYSTADAIGDVNTSGYFNTLSDTLDANSVQANTFGTSSQNAYGARTVSTGNPSGGSNGDIWYKI